MGKFVCSLAFSAIAAVSAAAAATPGAGIGEVSGKVRVDQGAGYVPATANMHLNTGDRVFIGKDSKAVLNYGACTFTVSKATVYTVAAQAPCAKGEQTASLAEDQAHVGGAVITPANFGAATPIFDFNTPTIYFAIGGSVVAGIVGFLVFRDLTPAKPVSQN